MIPILNSFAERVQNPLTMGGLGLLTGGGFDGMLQGMQAGQRAQHLNRKQLEEQERAANFRGLLDDPEVTAGLNPGLLKVMAAAGPDSGMAMLGQHFDPNELLKRRQIEAELDMMPLKRRRLEADLSGGQNKMMADANSRAQIAASLGLQPGTDAYNSYVMTGRLPQQSPQARYGTPLDREMAKADVGVLKDAREAAAAGTRAIGALDELKAARDATKNEGPWLGWLPNVSAEAQRVQAAASGVQLEEASKLKGVASDTDMRIISEGVPNMSMSDDAATPIIISRRLMMQRANERAQFLDTWIRTHGSLSGAEAAWQQFVNDKPLITTRKDGSIIPNEGNVSGWQPYVMRGTQPVPGGMGAAPSPINPADPLGLR